MKRIQMLFRRTKHVSPVCPKTGKILKPNRKHRWLMWLFPITGLLALIWFLIRVVPKPSRATYPCQRVAAPLASAFVVWLVGLVSSAVLLRRARYLFRKSRYILAVMCVAAAVFSLWWALGMTSESAEAGTFTPIDPPNSSMGTGRGIHPGRVVWAHDAGATLYDGETGYWWQDQNNDQEIIRDMVFNSLCLLSGESNDVDAWDALFKHFNGNHDKGQIGYQPGEKIAIKLNLVSCGQGNPGNMSHISPQLTKALLEQLVYNAGVNPSDITVYDVANVAAVPDTIRNLAVGGLAGIRFVDNLGGNGRIKAVANMDAPIHHANSNVPTHCLPYCVTEADYIINLAHLRGHTISGVTLCAKNHFGSIWDTEGWNENPGWGTPWAEPDFSPGQNIHYYINAYRISWGLLWDCPARPMGSYNPIVEVMGHKDLGEKTVLFMIDGLYATPKPAVILEGTSTRWNSEPFNGWWSSSIFVSQDGVAIDSVGLDFLRGEGEPVIPYLADSSGYSTVDDYLHEAALANDPCSGTFYDPEGDGTRLASLGVHEHWNNPIDKQYSRNLGTGNGIELVIAWPGSVNEPVIFCVDTDANGQNNGLSWADAFNCLQDALDAALKGDEVHVAEGICKPDQGGYNRLGDRTATFQLKNGVAIYGGFPSGGGTWKDRDPNAYETILSGDLAGDDGPNLANNGENSYHVVTGSETNATAVLDGFTITAGNANGSWVDKTNKGGGMYNNSGSPTLTNCTFSGNSAGNSGGGMYNDSSSPTLTNCTFSGNSAEYSGGGMSNLESYPTLTSCIFSGNSAEYEGGGMSNQGGSPTVTNCTFSGNSAIYGGGMLNLYSSPTLTNCTFSGNSASFFGGGMLNNWKSNPTVTNCTFSGNTANYQGGGMMNLYSSPTLTNCTITGNSAAERGGGLSYYYGNITNCIVWDNWPDQIDGSAWVTYSDVQGGWAGEGNIAEDPCFVEPDNDDYHLLPTSPCIDAGDPDYPYDPNETDLDGNPRVIGGCVDMGAFEANYIEVAMKFTPQALNPDSQGKWVKAHLVLPDGFAVDDVDVNTPAKLCPLGIESDYINVFINEDDLVEIEIGFGRAAFCGRTDYGPADVIVIGLLTTGQYFYGTDTIRIITNNLEYLAVFASYWLEADCGVPDWCSGFDLDRDSVVNFIDFAMFDSCCVEIITQ